MTVSDGIPGRRIHRLAVSSLDDYIYVETEQGLYSYNWAFEHWMPESSFPVEYNQDSRPKIPLPDILIPYEYRFDVSGYITDSYFRDWEVTALIRDMYTDLFLGTWGLGVFVADDRSLIANHIPGGLLHRRVDAIHIDGDSIWVGGNGGQAPAEYQGERYGVTLMSRFAGTFTHFEPRFIQGFDSEIIYDITSDSNNVYFAGRHGLTVYTHKNDYYYTMGRGDGLPSNEVTALSKTGDSLWIGTTRGLALYMPRADTLTMVGGGRLKGIFITDLLTVGHRLLIGTADGAYYIDTKLKKIGELRDPDGGLRSQVRHISANKNEVFISTSWGLVRIDLESDKAETISAITEVYGVFAAAANERYIAAAVEDGLLILDRERNRERLFTTDEGLPSINISSMVLEGEQLWLGTDRGLSRFDLSNHRAIE